MYAMYGKRDGHFVRNFDKFKYVVVIFDKQHNDSITTTPCQCYVKNGK